MQSQQILNSPQMIETLKAGALRQNEQTKEFCQQNDLAIALKFAIVAGRKNRAALIAALKANTPADDLEGTLEAINRLEFLCSALIAQIDLVNGEGPAAFRWLTDLVSHQTVLTMMTDEHGCEAELDDGQSVLYLSNESPAELLRELASHVNGEPAVGVSQLKEAIAEAIKVISLGESPDRFWELVEPMEEVGVTR